MAQELTLTEAVMASILERLQTAYGEQLEVAYFPQDPQTYHLAHPVGAVLIGYSRSSFGAQQSLDAAWVARELTFSLTLVFCQLRGSDGAIGYLDRLRETLMGFVPTHCDAPLVPASEYVVGQSPGIWQFGQDWTTRTVQVQAMASEPDFGGMSGAALLAMNFEGEL